MKKLWILIIMMILIVGCGSKTSEDKYKIGVLQLADHPSLDATYDGLVVVLNEKIGEDNYVLDYQNALGDPSNVTLMAQKLVDDENDVIYAIATNAAQAVYGAAQTVGIPVVFNAVTDPVEAGLVDSMTSSGRHATGVSDVAPIDIQMALIKEVLPNVKNVGMLYNTGEINSIVQIEIAEKEAEKLGITIIKQGVSNASEIETATLALSEKVDALYNITDNMIVSATAQVTSIAASVGIPVFAAEDGKLDEGILATDSIDYYNLGILGGETVVDILVNGKNPKDIPVKTVTETVLYVNQDVAESLGIALPQSVLDRAQ